MSKDQSDKLLDSIDNYREFASDALYRSINLSP